MTTKLVRIYKWLKKVGHDRQIGKIKLDEVEELLLDLDEDLKKDESGTAAQEAQR